MRSRSQQRERRNTKSGESKHKDRAGHSATTLTSVLPGQEYGPAGKPFGDHGPLGLRGVQLEVRGEEGLQSCRHPGSTASSERGGRSRSVLGVFTLVCTHVLPRLRCLTNCLGVQVRAASLLQRGATVLVAEKAAKLSTEPVL